MPTPALSPQLLSRAKTPPNGDDWIHEIKYDGYRLLASVETGRAWLRSRPGADWTSRLPWIASAVASLPVRSAAFDGELVYLTDEGFPDFERLQCATRSNKQAARLYCQVFDLLSLDGQDLTSRPLLERKQRLVEVLARADNPRLRYVSHAQSNATEFFRAVDQLGLEGIVCKRARSIYRPGVRSSDWIKVKCFHTQQFAVIGYTVENGLLASLALAGRNADGEDVYVGRVEFGVPRRDDTLLGALQTLGQSQTNAVGASERTRIRWVEPRLTAEVRALRWMPGRALRHATLRSIFVASSQVRFRHVVLANA